MAPFPRTTLPAHLKPGIGRPSEYRPEYCQMVIEKMAEGYSLTAFAGSILVAAETVYEWIRVHSEFGRAVSRAKPARVYWLEGKLLKSRKGAETTAAIFALRNAAPNEWRDIKHTSTDVNVRYEQLTTAQLNAIAAGQNIGDANVIDGESERIATS